ncbi:acetylxylan esterase [Lentisphaera profundi]|uniref:Acetylxylan esterase n=1 Tax=Lentisphaera profundi TaxID=1658616 RepID=A0ABY7VPX3_9BACT|nr:acetylxylan esterase [Lentisphaera profundi]WDE95354.1 acetylxylan esterase [Lentisphaera profundi]
MTSFNRFSHGILVAILISFSHLAFCESLPWDLSQIHKNPQWQKTDLAPAAGMTALLYNSLSYTANDVQVFAYYSAPEGTPPEGGWPAVVCVHGGGGTAFPQWVKKWNEHGYAAISMDLEGHIPLNLTGKKGRQPTPNPGPSRIGVFHDFDKPIKEQWYYHAMAQIMIAHSLIRSFPEVNADKTGLTGISWGGNLTSSVMGVDTRFKFAIPGYGCGFLPASSGHQGRAISDGKHSDVVNTYYDGSAYFQNVNYPTLWVNGTNDFHFAMPAFQKSAQATKAPQTMRIELEMNHGHGPVWDTEECYVFADSIVKGQAGLIQFEAPQAEADQARVIVAAPAKLKSAQLLYTLDADNIWPDKKWLALPAKIEANSISATLPPGTFAFYFNARDSRGMMSSSFFLEHQVEGLRSVETSNTQLDFDQLFTQAISSQQGKKILLAENFENDLSPKIHTMVNVKDPSGIAGIQEWYDEKASGGKSLLISNSPNVQHSFMPSLNQWFRGEQSLKSGALNLSFDILVPQSAHMAIESRDYSVKPSINHLSINLMPSTISLGKKSIQYQANQWLHLELSIPVNQNQADIRLKVQEQNGETHELSSPATQVKSLSCLGLMLPGKNDSKIYIDNLVISHIQNESH